MYINYRNRNLEELIITGKMELWTISTLHNAKTKQKQTNMPNFTRLQLRKFNAASSIFPEKKKKTDWFGSIGLKRAERRSGSTFCLILEKIWSKDSKC